MKKKKFSVWIDQVNQTRWEVSAFTKEEAEQKALKEWRKQYGKPYASDCRENGDN